MQLTKRVTLHYRAGSSDKVYEVDLCQIGDDRYLVNFRYGKRGKSLKEGSKTVSAVGLAEAERIFAKLIADKKKKGYRDVSEVAPETAAKKEIVNEVVGSDPRETAILNRLARQNGKNWLLDRVIWRAGELRIREAVPLLVKLISTGAALRNYCIAWALGRCGDRGAIPLLKILATENSHPSHVNRIAWEAIYRLSDANERLQLKAEKIAELPPALRELAKNGTSEVFLQALQAYLDTKDYKRFQVLDILYQIDNEFTRPAILEIVKAAPLQPNYFKQLRHIFKMAEYRGDGEIFGILAHRFELQEGNFHNHRRWEYNREERRYVYAKNRYSTEELKKPDSKRAYSVQTRDYLRRRIWRTLKTLGEEGEADYINLATGTLLQYTDADGQKAKHSVNSYYNYRTRSYVTNDNHWDKYATRIILNHILYENSPRYQANSQAWSCQGDYKPGNPTPEVREEAFPDLWDSQPTKLLRLLLESECAPVQEFAVKAIKDNKEYCASLDIPVLIKLLATKYHITAEFAFNLAQTKYNSQLPDRELVLAVANCILPAGRERAYQWIEEQREYFFSATDFIASLVTSQQADTRAFARRLLSSSILSEETAKVLIARIVSALLALNETQGAMAQEIGETLLLSFTPQLRTLGFNVILDLLAHPLPEIQVLGARILLNHQTPASELPPDLIESLLSSPHDSVRSVGIRIFGQLPDERLIAERILIIAMAVSSSVDIRHAIRPVIRRLAANQPEFALEIAIDFIDLLTEPERHEGVHKDLVTLLREEIPNWMDKLETAKIFALTRAKSSVARELGGIILQANKDKLYKDFSTSQLVKLADNEIVAIRQASWQMMSLKLDSIRHDDKETIAAVKLLASKWEDSQEFARSLFAKFQNTDWSPQVAIALCDSTQEDVRRFGRDVVTASFQQEYGQEYLLKFSEHPNADMQLFVTNYLENYAVGDREKLTKLKPYFITVLSGVNKGSVAKKRIFNFLDAEAAKNKNLAKIVAEILTRQSVTMAIADKAAAIQIMVKIKKQYPDLELPIQIKEVSEVRR